MYVPIILGSDKTTVSVATGQNDYHPVYLSIGNITNAVRRAHCNAVTPVAFLAIPKSKLDSSRNIVTDKSGAAEKDQEESEAFRCFRRQLQHISFGKYSNHSNLACANPKYACVQTSIIVGASTGLALSSLTTLIKCVIPVLFRGGVRSESNLFQLSPRQILMKFRCTAD